MLKLFHPLFPNKELLLDNSENATSLEDQLNVINRLAMNRIAAFQHNAYNTMFALGTGHDITLGADGVCTITFAPEVSLSLAWVDKEGNNLAPDQIKNGVYNISITYSQRFLEVVGSDSELVDKLEYFETLMDSGIGWGKQGEFYNIPSSLQEAAGFIDKVVERDQELQRIAPITLDSGCVISRDAMDYLTDMYNKMDLSLNRDTNEMLQTIRDHKDLFDRGVSLEVFDTLSQLSKEELQAVLEDPSILRDTVEQMNQQMELGTEDVAALEEEDLGDDYGEN